MFVVTLIYSDMTRWIAGGFSSQAEANAWVAAEQTKPYWNNEIQVEIVDHTPVAMEMP
jgi:hypothetical protein